MKKKIVLSGILILGMNNTVMASGIPTVDIANIIQTSVTAIENVEQVANQVTQIQNQIDQYRQQIKQFESMVGDYDMGDLLNSREYKDARRLLPKNWQETLALMDGTVANQSQTEAQTAARTARTHGQLYTAPTIYEDTSTQDAVEYVKQGQQIFTHMGVGQSNYTQSEQRIKNVEDLSAKIDTAHDLKAAIDLQNRLLSEQAILQSELIRLQSASHINASEKRLEEHNRRAADTAMADGTLPVIPPLQ